MKKIKFTGKLSLNKETVSKLNSQQMNGIVGGTGGPGCNTYTCQTCPPPNTFDGCFSQMVSACCPTDGCTTPEFGC